MNSLSIKIPSLMTAAALTCIPLAATTAAVSAQGLRSLSAVCEQPNAPAMTDIAVPATPSSVTKELHLVARPTSRSISMRMAQSSTRSCRAGGRSRKHVSTGNSGLRTGCGGLSLRRRFSRMMRDPSRDPDPDLEADMPGRLCRLPWRVEGTRCQHGSIVAVRITSSTTNVTAPQRSVR